jgi:branched-chain amino acid transport system permease protein
MTADASRAVLGRRLTATRVAIGLGILVALLLPFIAEAIPVVPYRSVFKGLTFAFAAIGVAMLLRHLNLVSFGHAAFFGAGAYAVAMFASQLEISNLFVLLLLSVLVSTVLGVVVGLLVRSHLGIFFGLLTLALNQIIYATVSSLEFFNFSDGVGVRIDGQRPDLFGLQLELAAYDLFMHYLAVALLLVGLYCAWRISNSPFGRTISAIGQNRVRAEFVGIDVERYVLLTFVITSVYAGVGGGLFALFELHVRPDPTLHIFRSGEMLFMAILGGVETIAGPVFGSVILIYLLDTVHILTEYFDLLTGLILIAIVFLLPDGIVGVDYGEAVAAVRDDPTLLYTWVRDRF